MLNKIIAFSIKNKLVVGFFTLLLIVWGAWSATKLPIDALPDITNNQVQIITVTPTLATQEVEQFVTYPIEKSLANLPDGSATAITKNNKNEISYTFLNLYNYRENILHSKKLHKGPLPIDYSIKSYNDLVQSIINSVMQSNNYNWIICEGQSEKIYFDLYFHNEIENERLRILPVGGFKEVKKIYSYLTTPIKDPDYKINGKVYCLIDTDEERVDIKEYTKDKNLFFERLVLRKNESILVDVNDNLMNPPTEIEDCLNPIIFYHSLQEFNKDYPEIDELFSKKILEVEEKYSGDFFDLTKKEKESIDFFLNDNDGYNKILFAKKYVELAQKPFFNELQGLEWVDEIKDKIKQ